MLVGVPLSQKKQKIKKKSLTILFVFQTAAEPAEQSLNNAFEGSLQRNKF